MNIGNWVRRSPTMKWHLIDSVVADEPFTRCGRRLRIRKWHGVKVAFQISEALPIPDTCKKCFPA